MSDMDVDEVKQQNTYNSLLKNKEKPKDPIIDESASKSKRVVFQDKPIILNKVASKTSDGVSTKNDTNEGEKNRDKKERIRPPTKVVVRRLPPTMTLETFVDHVSPMPEHDYIYFVKADMSLGANAFSRAYINFINISDLLTFYEQFDNYVFMDNKGNEYPAVVEFAPFQRVPKKRPGRKKDPKAGTLKDDPAYLAFVQSLREKKDANAAKHTSAEHLLALTTENSSKKEVTTPLLEFLKQRRAERQRIRDEKREERRRKELERKRIKEEERRRRKDGDSVMKVLRNPEHDDKDDTGRGSKDRDRDRPQSSLRKREDERQRNRDKDKKDSRQMQDSRQRDIKGRGDSGPKSYREDRQKQMDSRMQRKALDEQRKKPGMDRNQGPNKLSDTRRSQEFDRPGHVKDGDSRKKDIEEKKTYGDRHSRDGEPRKGYRDSDMKRSDRNQGYNKDYDRRKNSYSSDRKYSHSYGDSESRRRSNDYKIHGKPENKHVKESKAEVSKAAQSQDETDEKKWELLGAKPKSKAAPATTEEKKMEEAEEEMEVQEDVKKTEELEDPPGFVLKRRNSVDSSDIRDSSAAKSTTEATSNAILRRRSSLESDVEKTSKEFDVKPRRQSSLDPEVSVSEAPLDVTRKSIPLSKSQEFEKTACSEVVHKRRGSLDSGDHDVDGKSKASINVDAEVEKLNRNGSVDSKEGASSSDKDRGDSANRSDENGGGTDADRKRDPRAERRIRNKDRPSIEIYRPGMGRFSMQRKEREKGVGSSTEQDSPSTSPSPTPSGRISKTTKSNQELRSMTFKRSVSREK